MDRGCSMDDVLDTLSAYSHRLVKAAQDMIRQSLQHRSVDVDLENCPAALQQNGASFVTLQLNHRLRGCIGSLEAHKPLVMDVLHNAHAAAFRDSRFQPLHPTELQGLDLSISVLTPMEPVAFDSEAHLLDQLRPSIDGLLIRSGEKSAVYLPEVWEQIPEPQAFLDSLKLKGSIDADAPLQAWRYTTHKTLPVPFG